MKRRITAAATAVLVSGSVLLPAPAATAAPRDARLPHTSHNSTRDPHVATAKAALKAALSDFQQARETSRVACQSIHEAVTTAITEARAAGLSQEQIAEAAKAAAESAATPECLAAIEDVKVKHEAVQQAVAAYKAAQSQALQAS